MAYTPTSWVNDSAPAINASNLNKLETGVDVAHDSIDSLNTSVSNLNTQVGTNTAKLSGIATGATVNDTDANLKNRANHTGTQSADTITDGTTNKAYTATEKAKLASIEENIFVIVMYDTVVDEWPEYDDDPDKLRFFFCPAGKAAPSGFNIYDKLFFS